MIVSPNQVRGVTIEHAKPKTLFMGNDGNHTRFLIGRDDRNLTVAVVLDGEEKFKSFVTAGNSAWTGFELTPISFKLDLALATTTVSNPVGHLVVTGGRIEIVGYYRLKHEIYTISLGDTSDTNLADTSVPLYFPKWHVMLDEKDADAQLLYSS